MTKQGPGPAAFLLLAEGHLSKAMEILDQEPLRRAIYDARHDTMKATNLVRHARTILNEEKEEPSGWDLPENTDEWGQSYGRCPKCGTPWDIVRPGKGQPACECEEEET